MKQVVLLLAVVILVTSLMSGCDGVAYSYGERMQRYRQRDYWQQRMIVDDWDYAILHERATYLSEWYPRAGQSN